MRPSEKLMLLLELNNYNIDKYKLKMQIEYEKNGNIELYKINEYSELLVCHYLYDVNKDYFSRNPLTYRFDWDIEVNSLDQFIINHPDINEKISIKEFLESERFNEDEKGSILSEVVQKWKEEYSEARNKSIENIRDFIILPTAKNNKYHKPSIISFVFAILFVLFNTLLFIKPEMIEFSYISNYVIDWNKLLYDTPWYSLFGVVSILLFILYVFLNNSFSRQIRVVNNEKDKSAIKRIDKCDKDLEKAIKKQSTLLDDYVGSVINKPNETKLELKTLIKPKILLEKLKDYIERVEIKYNLMTKKHSNKTSYLRLLYLFALIFNIAFIGMGFAIIRGLINV